MERLTVIACAMTATIIILIGLPARIPADAISGTVTQVAEPISLVIQTRDHTLRYHLAGLVHPAAAAAGPELREALEREARDHLETLVRSKRVSVLAADAPGIPGQQDLVYRKEDGALINAEMLLHGDARFDRRYQGRSHDLLAQAEAQARKARVGCWARAAELDALVAAYRNLSSTNEKAK